ncbi:MAG: hypothetical protein ISR75_06375 [Phycisphaerales bacterium]|nr:hypothetical protein [Planctomycetota bacterium]MBL6998044.1 hypothetical protein [Phycisphaerales bacterium]
MRCTPLLNVVTAIIVVTSLVFGSSAFSDDYGSWAEQEYGMATYLAGVSFPDTQNGWSVGGIDGVGVSVHKTTNGGENWSTITSGISGLMYLGCDSVDKDMLWVVGVQFLFDDGMMKTTDGGETWQMVTMPGDIWSSNSVDVVDAQHIKIASTWKPDLWSADKTGMTLSNDGGNSWQTHEWGLNTWARYCFFLDNNRGWMTGGDFPDEGVRSGGYRLFEHGPTLGNLPRNFQDRNRGSQYQAAIAKTTDGGQTWTQLFWHTGEFYLNNIFMLNDNEGWAVGSGGYYVPYLMHTTDGWTTWEFQTTPTGEYSLVTIDFMNASEGYAVGFGPNGAGDVEMFCLHTMDGGQTWLLDKPGLNTGPLDVEFFDSSIAWAVGSSNMNQSTVALYTNDTVSECPPEDIDGDGIIGTTDLLAMIGAWGPCSGCPEDIDNSGTVDTSDLLSLIGVWGPCE